MFRQYRAESGYNIILVVQMPSEAILFEACAMSGEQLVVYDFGETFGGYWGLIPQALVQQPVRNYTQFYTLKTTKPPTLRYYKFNYLMFVHDFSEKRDQVVYSIKV